MTQYIWNIHKYALAVKYALNHLPSGMPKIRQSLHHWMVAQIWPSSLYCGTFSSRSMGAPERDVMWDPHATCSTSWKDAFLIIHIFYGHMSHIGGWFFTMFDQNSGIHLLHFTT